MRAGSAQARTTSPTAPRARRAPIECGDLPFLIKRDGTWLYRGTPIGRKELVCLFASVLKREADGSFWLQTPAERGRIEVEDAPFTAVELDWTGAVGESRGGAGTARSIASALSPAFSFAQDGAGCFGSGSYAPASAASVALAHRILPVRPTG